MLRPKLTILASGTSIDPTCKDPHELGTVKLTVHSNLALAPSQGWVTIEDGTGAVKLKGYDVMLPKIGGNASVPLTVALGTTAPPSSLVGHHGLVVSLKPKFEGGQPAFDPPSAPATTWAYFPTGYCPSARVIPPPPTPARKHRGR